MLKFFVVIHALAFVLVASDLYFIESKKVRSFFLDCDKDFISLIVKSFLSLYFLKILLINFFFS